MKENKNKQRRGVQAVIRGCKNLKSEIGPKGDRIGQVLSELDRFGIDYIWGGGPVLFHFLIPLLSLHSPSL